MFAGSLVALITPFKNGSVDEKGFEKFVGWQIKEGTDGLVPCGTTGESPTLVDGRAQAGDRHLHRDGQGHGRAGDRRHRLELDRRGDRAHPARQEGRRRRRHAGRAVLQQADPGRPVPALQGGGRGGRHPDPALQRAAAHRRRHAGRDRGRGCRRSRTSSASRMRATTWRGRRSPGSRPRRASCQLSGEDASAVGFLAQGGDGCISVTANVAPRLCADMHDAWKAREPRQGVRDPGPADAAAQGDVLRDQPRPGEVRRRADRPVAAPRCACRWCRSPRAARRPCARRWSTPA